MREWRALCAAVFIVAVAMSATTAARAGSPKDDVAPTGKLRVAIAVGPTAGVSWCARTDGGYAGIPAELGKAMADQLGVPLEYVAYQNSGEIADAAAQGTWDVSFLPKEQGRETGIAFGPAYQAADATYLVKAGSTVGDAAALDKAGAEVAAIRNTPLMRGAQAQLKKAKVTGFQTYDEMFNLMKYGELDAVALPRDELEAMASKIPGTRVLNGGFAKIVTAVAVPQGRPQALAFVTRFMTDARVSGQLRKAHDNYGLKETQVPTQ